ncbi:hypothetical protein CL632_02735 [bacterium]|jgi:thiamine kinase-like enzyme|nr:hypothetical protein [bacterium]MDP6571515.1 aminoglycoside phosphotransferase family protein [Patescibacteria group bacterium]|tara:strand:+ start:3341 stop:4336 length:996 start_codon:yes stop_codon:yes gene_type:complete
MKPIEQLFDPKFAKQYLEKHAPNFTSEHNLSGLTVKSIKRNIGGDFYHVVIQYDAPSLGHTSIFCTAHAEEDRNIAFRALSFINKHGFKGKDVFLPNPLFFDKKLKVFCYQGVDGKNLLYYITQQKTDLSRYLKQAAHWIAALHQTPINKTKNFNPANSYIKTAIPADYFLPKINRLFPNNYQEIKSQFEKLVKFEEKNISTLNRKYLIHGDFHPENVIINASDGKVSVIDFTDICLADWTRDVGSFMQQLRYMSRGMRNDDETKKYQQLFMNEYLTTLNIKKTTAIEKRITLYRAWTAIRSTIFFLTKEPAEPRNAATELNMTQELISKL